jgi:DNA-binding transcriptional LysR family regulator
MDKLAAMRAFVEIVDRGSFTAAGEALDRSLPTMVRILAALESSLGTVLLRRTTRHMSLTEEGRIYLERCRRILADVEQAEELVGSEGGEPRGLLRVSAPVLFGKRHVAPAVVEFVARYPKIEVDLLCSTVSWTSWTRGLTWRYGSPTWRTRQ